MRCFSVTQPRTFPEPLLSSASRDNSSRLGFPTVECFGFSNGAKTSTVWRLRPPVFTVSLNKMSINKSTKKKNLQHSFFLQFPFHRRKTIFVLWTLEVRSSLDQKLSVYLGSLVRLHSIPLGASPPPTLSLSLSAWSLRLHAPSTCLSFISTRDQTLKDVSMFTVFKLS